MPHHIFGGSIGIHALQGGVDLGGGVAQLLQSGSGQGGMVAGGGDSGGTGAGGEVQLHAGASHLIFQLQDDALGDLFTHALSGGQELFVKEIGKDYYKIIHTYEGMLENEKFEYIFDKETLELREYNFVLFDDTTGSTVVHFNKPLSENSSEVIEIMDGERKSITVNSELYDFDEVIRNEVVLSIPSEWKLELLAGVEIALYSNEEQTEIYEYPGHGIDHTIYVTNSLG